MFKIQNPTIYEIQSKLRSSLAQSNNTVAHQRIKICLRYLTVIATEGIRARCTRVKLRVSRRGREREFTCRVYGSREGRLPCLTSRFVERKVKTVAMRINGCATPRQRNSSVTKNLRRGHLARRERGGCTRATATKTATTTTMTMTTTTTMLRIPSSSALFSSYLRPHVPGTCGQVASDITTMRGVEGGTIIISFAVPRYHERTRLGQSRQLKSQLATFDSKSTARDRFDSERVRSLVRERWPADFKIQFSEYRIDRTISGLSRHILQHVPIYSYYSS